MNNIKDILEQHNKQIFATNVGTGVHAKLQNVFCDDGTWTGDLELIEKIKKNPELTELFGMKSKTEVPIAGYINNQFVSRRIDRLYTDKVNKKIVILDYKTDSDKNTPLRDKYVKQLGEYYDLIKQIYPGFIIECKILWMCDFTLENIK